MTVFDAKTAIELYWRSPKVSPLLEAAKYSRLMSDLCRGLTECSARLLMTMLNLRLPSTRSDKAALTLLARHIDRRPRLGIAAVVPDAEQSYRRRGRVVESRRGKVVFDGRTAA